MQKIRKSSHTVKVDLFAANLKRKVRRHLVALGYTRAPSGALVPAADDKATYRAVHSRQRGDRFDKYEALVRDTLPEFLRNLADGREVQPAAISPRLHPVAPRTLDAALFRVATMTWSIPVSDGFGRRLRFLVRDDHTGKLIGLIALGDPVFNLGARDRLIGWNASDRTARLVNVLDAFVLGALPPYNALLTGKLVACLIKTREVEAAFRKRYGTMAGTISGVNKNARLALVTTTSAMGRSSVYNRLRIGNHNFFEPIGFTEGYGHFHLTDDLFTDLREYLARRGDPYATNNRFGQGPNWKMRVVRKALTQLGLGEELLQHGFKREIYQCALASNAVDYLNGKRKRPDFSKLLTTSEVSSLCLERWILPRAQRRPDYMAFRPENIIQTIKTGVAWQPPPSATDVHSNPRQD